METYATFEKGDTVRATLTTLLLTAGNVYTVFKTVKTNREPWQYAYYVSDVNGELIRVKNAHIVLEAI